MRNAHQSPVRPSYSGGAAWPVPAPGRMTRPSTMPMTTETSEVMPNHRMVCQARRAALVTLERLAIEATTAKKTSGMTADFSSDT